MLSTPKTLLAVGAIIALAAAGAQADRIEDTTLANYFAMKVSDTTQVSTGTPAVSAPKPAFN